MLQVLCDVNWKRDETLRTEQVSRTLFYLTKVQPVIELGLFFEISSQKGELYKPSVVQIQQKRSWNAGDA